MEHKQADKKATVTHTRYGEKRVKLPALEEVIKFLEALGHGWDVGHTCPHFYEARVWRWPNVAGRCRESGTPVEMLLQAMANADVHMPGVKMPEPKEPRV